MQCGRREQSWRTSFPFGSRGLTQHLIPKCWDKSAHASFSVVGRLVQTDGSHLFGSHHGLTPTFADPAVAPTIQRNTRHASDVVSDFRGKRSLGTNRPPFRRL